MLGKRDKDGEVRLPSDELEKEHSFDDLAKGLASSTVSRGKALKLMGAALLGSAAVPFLGARPAQAKKHHKKKHKKPPAFKKRCLARGGKVCLNKGNVRCCPHGTNCCPSLLTNGISCCDSLAQICSLGVCIL